MRHRESSQGLHHLSRAAFPHQEEHAANIAAAAAAAFRLHNVAVALVQTLSWVAVDNLKRDLGDALAWCVEKLDRTVVAATHIMRGGAMIWTPGPTCAVRPIEKLRADSPPPHAVGDGDSVDVPFIVLWFLRKPLRNFIIPGQARQCQLAKPDNRASSLTWLVGRGVFHGQATRSKFFVRVLCVSLDQNVRCATGRFGETETAGLATEPIVHELAELRYALPRQRFDLNHRRRAVPLHCLPAATQQASRQEHVGLKEAFRQCCRCCRATPC
jgi:hypothetical protein